jgi:hypothetical protein
MRYELLRSVLAVHCHFERGADFAHFHATESTEAFNEYTDRDALNQIEVDAGMLRYGIFSGVK